MGPHPFKFAPGQDGLGIHPNGTFSPIWYYVPKGWREDGRYSYDWAVVILEDDPRLTSIGWFGMAALKASKLDGTSAWVFGYPLPFFECPSFLKYGENYCWGYLWGSEGKITRAEKRRVRYRMDVEDGMSGSPIYRYNDGDRQILAIANTKGSEYNGGVRLTKSRIDQFCSYNAEWRPSSNPSGCIY